MPIRELWQDIEEALKQAHIDDRVTWISDRGSVVQMDDNEDFVEVVIHLPRQASVTWWPQPDSAREATVTVVDLTGDRNIDVPKIVKAAE